MYVVFTLCIRVSHRNSISPIGGFKLRYNKLAGRYLHTFRLVKRKSVPVGIVALPETVPGLELRV